MSKFSRQEPPEAGSLAFTFVALVLVFTGLGYLLDRWLHTGPWLMVSGVFVGAGLGFVYLVFIMFAGSSKHGSRGEGEDDKPGPGRSGGD
jgi:F0F1-type ATP synthase assembly protein I